MSLPICSLVIDDIKAQLQPHGKLCFILWRTDSFTDKLDCIPWIPDFLCITESCSRLPSKFYDSHCNVHHFYRDVAKDDHKKEIVLNLSLHWHTAIITWLIISDQNSACKIISPQRSTGTVCGWSILCTGPFWALGVILVEQKPPSGVNQISGGCFVEIEVQSVKDGLYSQLFSTVNTLLLVYLKKLETFCC